MSNEMSDHPLYLGVVFWWNPNDRKGVLADLDRRPSPARENAFTDAIDNAVELMRRLDARFLSASKPR
jgi:hypothetical protein